MQTKGLGLSQTVMVLFFTTLIAAGLVYAGTTGNTTLNATVGNTAPVMNDVEVQSAGTYGPTSCATTAIAVRFNATDANGWGDINLSNPGTNCTVSYGVTIHTLSAGSCTKISNSSTTKALFQCTGTMDWYDTSATNWSVNCTVIDSANDTDFNDTANLTYTSLDSVAGNGSLTWTGLTSASTDVGADDDPIVLTNCGNNGYTDVNVTGYDLSGVTTPAEKLAASDFSVNVADAANGDALVNATAVTVTGASLAVNGTEQLYEYYEQMTIPVSAQAYNNSGSPQVEEVWNA